MRDVSLSRKLTPQVALCDSCRFYLYFRIAIGDVASAPLSSVQYFPADIFDILRSFLCIQSESVYAEAINVLHICKFRSTLLVRFRYKARRK